MECDGDGVQIDLTRPLDRERALHADG